MARPHLCRCCREKAAPVYVLPVETGEMIGSRRSRASAVSSTVKPRLDCLRLLLVIATVPILLLCQCAFATDCSRSLHKVENRTLQYYTDYYSIPLCCLT